MPDPGKDEAFHELCAYTLLLGDALFIHQHVVDAFAAQNASEISKPISITFALVGLYLHFEKRYTGREVQLAHMKMAKERKNWPRFEAPPDRATMTAADVMKSPPGAERDAAIREWCAAVWASWSGSREQVAELARAELGYKVDVKLPSKE